MKEEDEGRFYVTNVHGNDQRIVVLADIYFWAKHQKELDIWCQENGAIRRGMTIDMDERTMLLFALRWA